MTKQAATMTVAQQIIVRLGYAEGREFVQRTMLSRMTRGDLIGAQLWRDVVEAMDRLSRERLTDRGICIDGSHQHHSAEGTVPLMEPVNTEEAARQLVEKLGQNNASKYAENKIADFLEARAFGVARTWTDVLVAIEQIGRNRLVSLRLWV